MTENVVHFPAPKCSPFKCPNSLSDQSPAANSGPMPPMSSNIVAGAGLAVCCTANNASRAAYP
jgi:hypothetical protein